jgi:Zn-dependent protease with chaperone function
MVLYYRPPESYLRAPFDFAQDMLRVLRGEIIPTINTLAWLMRQHGDSGGGIFATHPATSERIQALQNLR